MNDDIKAAPVSKEPKIKRALVVTQAFNGGGQKSIWFWANMDIAYQLRMYGTMAARNTELTYWELIVDPRYDFQEVREHVEEFGTTIKEIMDKAVALIAKAADGDVHYYTFEDTVRVSWHGSKKTQDTERHASLVVKYTKQEVREMTEEGVCEYFLYHLLGIDEDED